MNIKLAFMLCLTASLIRDAQAGSATWNANPTSNEWNTSANWTPATVPNSATDIASFDSSNTMDLAISHNTECNSIMFNADASAFTFAPIPGKVLTISGGGVTNDSGVMQNFVTAVDSNFERSRVTFSNSATAGSLVTYTLKAASVTAYGGELWFIDSSSAGNATFVIEGGAVGGNIVGGSLVLTYNASAGYATFITNGGSTTNSNGGALDMAVNATAANATFINNPGTAPRAQGGAVDIQGTATASDATFINNGSSIPGAGGGVTIFHSGTNAGNSTLIANGSTNGGRGGEIWFDAYSHGGTPRVEVFGDGFLEASSSNIAIGSLEGDGIVFLGTLLIGTNDLDTVFSGTIRDTRLTEGGTLRKTGRGTLILTGANSYSGPTTILQGTLDIGNFRGSGTGSGPVHVRGGQLTGDGTVSGATVVGNSTGPQATINPGHTASNPKTLTIANTLTFDSTGVYLCSLNSNKAAADQLSVSGITIGAGATVLFDDAGSTALSSGTTFRVIDNTGASQITGTFSNLPDGATVTVGSNTFQANYEGGDGNDLTLTVMP